ncbi:hypothetical protein ACLB1O_24415 [Escherichia coli]
MRIGIISYITINYLVKFDFHFLYVLACTFCINVVVMLVIGFIKPRATPFTFKDAFAVDMKPWKNSQDRVNWHPVRDDWRLCRAGWTRRLRYALVSDDQLFHCRRSDCLPDF